jgi:RNA-directed DNA polymerase
MGRCTQAPIPRIAGHLAEHERAGQRVMQSLTAFITRRLKLKINAQKSAVARPVERKFLGFSFTSGTEPRRRIAPKAITRFKRKARQLTRRTRGISIEQMVKELSTYLRGWRSYFGFCQTPTVLRNLDSWIHRRLRAVLWKQWKRGRKRFAELRQCGVREELAAKAAGSVRGPWRLAHSPALAIALPNTYFDALGLLRLVDPATLNPPNRRMRTRMSGGVAGARG